jgi:hypothetical protein
MEAYTVGLVKLKVHDRLEDAIGAGSGTLVRVGKVHGILTAAHTAGQRRGGDRRIPWRNPALPEATD